MRTNPLKFFGARRRMSVFRFCRQGLTVLTVVLALMACDQLLPTGGSGELVAVKIRAVRVAGGAQNETVTRASGGEKRMEDKPIVQDLGDGMFAEITVEEDVSALRDATPLGSGSPVKFRVIAVNSSDNKVYSYADYTAGSGAITRDNDTPDLHVVSGGSYYFVCISYNNSALPPAPNGGDDLSNLTIAVTAADNDLLWQKTEAKPISGEVNLDFTELKQRLAVVKLVFNTQSEDKTISTFDNSKITLGAVGTEGGFSLTGGTVSSITKTETLPFGGWGDTGSQTLESGEIRFIPQATEDYTLTIAKDAVAFSGAETTPAASISIPCAGFVAGSRYTIRLRLAPCGKNGVANSLKIGNGNYLTHVYGSDALRRCWMVQNSKEGTTNLINNGIYYYLWADAAGACPSGWRLPSSEEATAMAGDVTSDRSGVGQWWLEDEDGENTVRCLHE